MKIAKQFSNGNPKRRSTLANTNTMRFDDPCVHELVELDDSGGKVLTTRTATVSSLLTDVLNWHGGGGDILHLGEVVGVASGIKLGELHFPEDHPPVVVVRARTLRLESHWFFPRADFNLVCGIIEFCRTNHFGKFRSATVDQLLDEFRRRGDRKRSLDFGGRIESVVLERLPAITAAVAIGKSGLADDARGLLAAVRAHFVR
jgi:hypothetical protein